MKQRRQKRRKRTCFLLRPCIMVEFPGNTLYSGDVLSEFSKYFEVFIITSSLTLKFLPSGCLQLSGKWASRERLEWKEFFFFKLSKEKSCQVLKMTGLIMFVLGCTTRQRKLVASRGSAMECLISIVKFPRLQICSQDQQTMIMSGNHQ